MGNIKKHNAEASILRADFSVPYRYNIHFTEDLFAAENPLVRDFFTKQNHAEDQRPKVLFMIDEGVTDHHPDLFSKIKLYFDSLPDIDRIRKFYILPGGEQVKNNRKTQAQMLAAIDKHGIDRHSYVIAIGGGAVLDAAGYAAAISHRGVRHIRIPTTVLSQNDSGIGVKNGINYFGKKNFLGSFAPPMAVWNDFQFLDTLSGRDQRAGLAEAVKVALIKDARFFEWLEQHSHELNNFDEKAMQKSIIDCARLHLKHIVTSGDPFERGSARPLDFGHWAGHKLEDLTGYKIRHGEAVAVGIMLDSIYSHLMGFIDRQSQDRILDLFDRLGFASSRKYLEGMRFDQLLGGLQEFREHLGGKLTITLLKDIGQGFEVHDIDHEKMKEAFMILNHQKTINEN